LGELNLANALSRTTGGIMKLATTMISGTTVSDAWLRAVTEVDAAPGQRLYHLVTQIAQPVEEHPEIRDAANWLSDQLAYPAIQTVANTIFPHDLAATCANHEELADRYLAMYDVIKGLDRANRHGTYFGRLVDYPSPAGSCNQLASLVHKLKVETASHGPKAARYELNIAQPVDDSGLMDGSTFTRTGSCQAAPIYVAGQDNSPMGFPCLSFCSFQLDNRTLHMVAHYRRQHLIERGYGNYLGLGRLLSYVSDVTETEVGALTIVAGIAVVDAARYRVYELTRRANSSTSSIR
jgi:hypothetical protein